MDRDQENPGRLIPSRRDFRPWVSREHGEYPPIGYHGIIGDTHTACLVGLDGSIDWYCYPHFDDPPIFASLLDAKIGGRFAIEPRGGQPLRQLYLPDTNVLLTRLLSGDGALEVIDFAPVREEVVEDEKRHWHGLVRQVRAVSSPVRSRLVCTPTFDYARTAPEVTLSDRGALFEGAGRRLELVSPVSLARQQGGPGEAGVVAEFTARPEKPLWFVLRDPAQGEPYGHDPQDQRSMDQLLTKTLIYWRNWAERCTYKGRWQERVLRSALTLKLLTFSPTGAIVAAPTTSLPEYLGGVRNWDYRYSWVRDAAFTLRALFRLGYADEGRSFFKWLTKRIRESDSKGAAPVQPLYGIDGRAQLQEETLDHLHGYRGSKPVRKGNAAYKQMQLDVFGELLETLSDYSQRVGGPGPVWQDVMPLLDWLADHWREPDEGIWEIRGRPQHFVYSKTMCWMAFDRAIRLAERYDLPGDVERWKKEREAVREQILRLGVHPEKGYFTQTFDNESLDAANLLMPLYGFLPAEDPRVKATLDATLEWLTTGDLVHRYIPDRVLEGVTGHEGAFSLCFFWLTDNLVLQGELDRAWLGFEIFMTYANHLQLYAEQLDHNGESLGNFPQAFTHIGLIYSALLLDRALTERTQQGRGAAASTDPVQDRP